jgi:DNA-3-methyladenine glycosylase I
LRKRENFRAAFDGFDAERIARYRAKDIARLMKDDGIVRNRAKIEATVDNARAHLRLGERTSLNLRETATRCGKALSRHEQDRQSCA